MKKKFASTFVTVTSIYSITVQAQNPNTNIQSFTNADLNQSPQNPSFSSTPGRAGEASSTTGTKYPALTADQLQQINDQMNAQVQLAEQRVQNLMGKVQDATRMPMSIDKVELDSAIMDLDVKKTLAAKFAGSPSLKSPKVRQILMQVLSKNFIQEADLAALQTVVNDERPFTYP